MNWGIIATGRIAASFAEGLRTLPDATLLAVASRTEASAAAFADRFGVPRRYDDYRALAADPDIEVVYVATPNNLHYENTLLCLNEGKHVLCEKPLALSGEQVRAMVDAARARERFLMEAMWMWFIPATVRAKELIEAGEIGEPRMLLANFGFASEFDPAHRRFNPELGGGALLDIGIYPLALALFLFGKPQRLFGRASLAATGIDDQMVATLEYDDGRLVDLSASFRAELPGEAIIGGSTGYLRIHPDFWHSQRLSTGVSRGGAAERVIEVPFEGNGLHFEAQHVMDRIRAGHIESDVMSWRASLDLIDMMDELRRQWAVSYPQEQ